MICKNGHELDEGNLYKSPRGDVCRACRNAAARRHYNRNKQQVLDRMRTYYTDNQGVRQLKQRTYHQDNPEVARRASAVRRARKKNAEVVEHVEPLVVLERDDGVCGICGHDVDPMNYHVDHIVPLSVGGEHSYANTQTAHPNCNRRKGTSF